MQDLVIFNGQSGIGYTYTHDRAGNVIGANAPAQVDYRYDGENRIKQMVNTSANPSYAYDFANRRVKRAVNNTTTHYIWEGNQVIAEHDAATGAVTAEYIYAGGRLIAREQGGSRRYYHPDRLSLCMLSDNSGNVVGTQDHLPFGEDGGYTGGESDTRHRFTNYDRDFESDTDYAINRQYANLIGRFMQVDPMAGSLADPQSLNRYAYVANDPVNGVDPDGLLARAIAKSLNSGYDNSY